MKPLVTWLLISALAFQWMTGHLYFRIVYSIEMEHRMDEREARLAAQLKKEMGLELRIRELKKAEFDPKFIGYGQHFFFSEEVDGENVLFSITPDTARTVEYEYLLGHGPEDNPQKQALLDRLFSKFTVSTLRIAIRKETPTLTFPNFPTSRLCALFQADVLTPPPQFQ